MEIAPEVPLSETVLVVLWSGIRVSWLIANNVQVAPIWLSLGLPFIKTMFLIHVIGNVGDGNLLHDEQAGKLPSVEFPLVPPWMGCGGLGPRHRFST